MAVADNVHELPRHGTEQDIRVQLAAAYRLVDHFGWTELIYGHLTARVPGPEKHFLINPYGLNYDEVTASSLIKIDIDGNIIGSSNYPVSKAGFIIHSAVHMADEGANHVVMHTHTRAGMAIAAIEEGLLPISMFATAFQNQLGYHPYEGPSLYEDERERLLASLADNKALILENHGLLAVGATVAEAFLRLYRLERACQVQLDAAAAGRLRVLDNDVATRSGAGIDGFSNSQSDAGIGALEYAALMRKLDKIDPSYRQ
ncbi:MAG: class II aldolase/adducin family protein [Chromatiales bacterium]|jgi:ribulose-5-phosphate 4-epimerase/fuculose-1-phosphate aldolase|nr:class II aldolase/adducin family protein [Chromatiales bacterium]